MCKCMCMRMVRSMCMCMCMVRSLPGVCILLMLVCTFLFCCCVFVLVCECGADERIFCAGACAGAGVLLFRYWCVHTAGVYISAYKCGAGDRMFLCADTCMLRRYTHTHSCAISFCAVCVCTHQSSPHSLTLPLTHPPTHSVPCVISFCAVYGA